MAILPTHPPIKIKAPPKAPSTLNIPETLKKLAKILQSLTPSKSYSSQPPSAITIVTVDPEEPRPPEKSRFHDTSPQVQQTEEEPPNDEAQERQIYRDSSGCIYITLCSLFLSAALAWLIINLITNNKDD